MVWAYKIYFLALEKVYYVSMLWGKGCIYKQYMPLLYSKECYMFLLDLLRDLTQRAYKSSIYKLFTTCFA